MEWIDLAEKGNPKNSGQYLVAYIPMCCQKNTVNHAHHCMTWHDQNYGTAFFSKADLQAKEYYEKIGDLKVLEDWKYSFVDHWHSQKFDINYITHYGEIPFFESKLPPTFSKEFNCCPDFLKKKSD